MLMALQATILEALDGKTTPRVLVELSEMFHKSDALLEDKSDQQPMSQTSIWYTLVGLDAHSPLGKVL